MMQTKAEREADERDAERRATAAHATDMHAGKRAATDAEKAAAETEKQRQLDAAEAEKQRQVDVEAAAKKAAYEAQPRVRLQRAIDAIRAHKGDITDRVAAIEAFLHHVAEHVMGQLPEAKPEEKVRPAERKGE
jgi:hypothetical protein